MLYKFEVEGFKGFEHKLSFDLSHQKNYEFNQECIRDGVIRKSIVYGKNGIGKSNLGLALFDIVSHLTDYNVSKSLYGGYV
ncbi:ATP-binding protein, partial [Cronobacter malonaticus]